jgi:Uma2 family endonuclease
MLIERLNAESAPPTVLETLPAETVGRGPLGPEDWRTAEAHGLPRCELLGGHLLAVPRPSLVHRALCQEVLARLRAWASRCSAFVLGAAPFALELADGSVVYPDAGLLLRCTQDASLPELVVEVLDGGDARREREWKTRLYADAGIPAYWIVDPWTRTVEFLELADGRYRLGRPEDGVYRPPRLPGLCFDLADLWWDAEQLVPFAF